MDSIYQNSGFTRSDETRSQSKGRSTESIIPKWTKVLLIVLAVSLVLALGGLCFLGMKYANVSVQLSDLETNGKKLEELTANYTRATEDLLIKDIKTRQLIANFTRVKEMLSFLEAQSVNCDTIWTDFQRKLYFFSKHELDWSSSHAFCVSRGADLVTITSLGEQIFLHSKMTSWHWIGLNDLETEGRWVWVNGQTLNETGVQFWHQRQSQKSEPDNWKKADPSGENCAIVKNDDYFTNSWFDVPCEYTLKFICEKKY